MILVILFNIVLGHRFVSVPSYKKGKGCTTAWYPIFRFFSVSKGNIKGQMLKLSWIYIINNLTQFLNNNYKLQKLSDLCCIHVGIVGTTLSPVTVKTLVVGGGVFPYFRFYRCFSPYGWVFEKICTYDGYFLSILAPIMGAL